eukprot:68085_1
MKLLTSLLVLPLIIHVYSKATLPLFVKVNGGAAQYIEVESSITIKQLYEEIKNKTQIQSNKKIIKLLFKGQLLNPFDDETIDNIGLSAEETLDVSDDCNDIQLMLHMFHKNDQKNIFGLDETNLIFQHDTPNQINQIAELLRRRGIIKYTRSEFNDSIHITEIKLLNIRPQISFDINWYYVPDFVERIWIRNSLSLQNINLNGLNSQSLKELHINYNHQLKTVHLPSLPALETLSFWNNCLQSFDLSPLNGSTSLKMIHLGDNQLQSLNLSPLKKLPLLKLISLSNNKLQSLDLSMLNEMISLKYINVWNNPQLQYLNVISLEYSTLIKIKIGTDNHVHPAIIRIMFEMCLFAMCLFAMCLFGLFWYYMQTF